MSAKLVPEPVNRDRRVPHVRHRPVEQVRLADELGNESAPRVEVELLRSAVLFDPALVQYDDTVGHRQRLILVVGHEEECLVRAALNGLELLLNLATQLRVERSERLVEQQEGGVRRQRAGKGHPLALSAGKLPRIPVTEFGQLEKRRQLVQPSLDVAPAHALQLEPERHVLPHVHVRKQRVVLKHHVHVAPVRRPVRDIAALEDHPSGVGRLEPSQDAQGRGLSAAGRPQQRHEFPRRDVELHPLQRHRLSEALGDTVETDDGMIPRHRSGDLFMRRVNRSAQNPRAAVSRTAMVAIALISGDIPERSSANMSTGSVGW